MKNWQDGGDPVEYSDPGDSPARERHQCDEQQEEGGGDSLPCLTCCLYTVVPGHQDADGGGCSLHPRLVAAAALRCPEPDGSSDKYVNISPSLLSPVSQY